jgi:hypothetical protein
MGSYQNDIAIGRRHNEPELDRHAVQEEQGDRLAGVRPDIFFVYAAVQMVREGETDYIRTANGFTDRMDFC